MNSRIAGAKTILKFHIDCWFCNEQLLIVVDEHNFKTFFCMNENCKELTRVHLEITESINKSIDEVLECIHDGSIDTAIDLLMRLKDE